MKRFCDNCKFIAYPRVAETEEVVNLCTLNNRRCVEERTEGVFEDACGPKARHFQKE